MFKVQLAWLVVFCGVLAVGKFIKFIANCKDGYYINKYRNIGFECELINKVKRYLIYNLFGTELTFRNLTTVTAVIYKNMKSLIKKTIPRSKLIIFQKTNQILMAAFFSFLFNILTIPTRKII